MATGYTPQALHTLLDATVDVYDGIGGMNANPPFATMTLAAADPWQSLSGYQNVIRETYTIEIFTTTAAERAQLARSVRTILDGYSGTVTIADVSPVTTVNILSCVFEDHDQDVDTQTGQNIYRHSLDFSITVSEA